MWLSSSTIFQMWKDSCTDLAAKLGVQFDFFFCDNDINKWQDTISSCAAAGYDGLIVSHGNKDGSYVFLKGITEQYPEPQARAVRYPAVSRTARIRSCRASPRCSSRTRAL